MHQKQQQNGVAGNSATAAETNLVLAGYQEISQAFLSARQKISLLANIQPENLSDQRLNFLNHGIEPSFEYRALTFDPDQLEREVQRRAIPRDIPALAELYEQLRTVILSEIEILKNRGDFYSDSGVSVRRHSAVIYGVPSSELVAQAEAELLGVKQSKQPDEPLALLSAEDVRAFLAQHLNAIELTDWEVKVGAARRTFVNPEDKAIVLGDRAYSARLAQMLLNHEIYVHVFRAANGYMQHPAINALMATGFPGYSSTEEGLAIYAESLSGTQSSQSRTRLAARVLAVDSAVNEMKLGDAFARLISSGIEREQAWDAVFGAYRGGGLIKDHIYFQGKIEIERYLLNGGDAKDLYVGKIGLQHLSLVQELKKEGLVIPGRYIQIITVGTVQLENSA